MKSIYILSIFAVFPFTLYPQWNDIQSFSPKSDEVVKSLPGDMDNDGYLDVVVASRDPWAISWQAGTPDPYRYAMSERIGTIFEALEDIELGDIDQDGDLDIIATVHFPTRLVWFENTGNQLFSDEQLIVQGEFLSNIQLQDVNNDDTLDICLTGLINSNTVDARFHILFGEGNAQFSSPASAMEILTSDCHFFDENPDDEFIDIYGNWRDFTTFRPGHITFNLSTLTFSGPEFMDVPQFNIDDVADLNGDNKPEIYGSFFQDGQYFYDKNNENWEFHWIHETPYTNFGITLVDIDQDGLKDIVYPLDSFSVELMAPVPHKLFWKKNLGDLEFNEEMPFADKLPGNSEYILDDFNNDGKWDIFYFKEDEARPSYRLKTDNDDWTAPYVFPISFFPDPSALLYDDDYFTVGDIDHDGDQDLIAFDVISNSVYSIRNHNNERFSECYVEMTDLSIGGKVSGGDFDGDGRFDLLFSQQRPLPDGELTWFSKEGDEWVPHLIDPEQYYQPYLYVEDMDNDDDMDIIASSGVHALNYYENDGEGNFAEKIVTPTNYSYSRTKLVDWDGDSDKDLIVFLAGDFNGLYLHRWNGTAFEEMEQLKSGGSWKPFSPFDFDGDGLPEMIIHYGIEDLYAWNNGTPLPINGQIIMDLPDGYVYGKMFHNDINADGSDDLFFMLTEEGESSSCAYLTSPGNLENPNWQYYDIEDSTAIALEFGHIADTFLPDIITFNHADQYLHWHRNNDYIESTQENRTPGYSLYPNPAGDRIQIVLDEQRTFDQYQCFSATGALLFQNKIPNGLNHFTINTSALKPGFYTLVLISKKGNKSLKKFIVLD